MAALFINSPNRNGFACGGSLINQKVVVTAAHCIQDKRASQPYKAEEATFHLGRHNFENLNEPNFVLSGVSQLIMHPDWDIYDSHFDADIAIAVLVKTISFNKFIKPICLWTSTSSFEDIIGLKATVAGWGKTEWSAVSTTHPNWADIPVVSEVKCLRSNSVFNSVTSERTFCAGDRDGVTSPCSGDSGGGLIVKSGTKWFLRGIVSAGIRDDETQSCDLKSYSVFTDVTKFTNWIQQQISTYS